MPKKQEVGSWEEFEAQFGTEEEKKKGYIKLHTLLKPYIIRRMKKDVEKSMPKKQEQILRVDMTNKQKKLYKLVLTKNYSELSKGKKKTSLLNILMQLRKTCNHSELMQEVDFTAKQSTQDRLQQLIYGSGKLVLLDKLLTRFKEAGDRVLIFSQMVIMLDVIQEYCELKRLRYQRLDGGISAEKRRQSIAQFNEPGSTDFCFLLSTKAGGLGINLQTANRVIIYDSDFNPQNDLQAIARAHRIGQKEEVKIFRLVASSSVDEDIIQKAKNKMVLDHLVIQNMDTTGKAVISGNRKKNDVQSMSKDEVNTIIKFGASDLFKETDDAGGEDDKDEVDLDAILEKAETREEQEAPISEANKELLSAFKCTNLRFEEEEPEPEEAKETEENKGTSWDDIIPEAEREKFKTKKKIKVDGLEVSDDEELYSRRRNKRKRKKVQHGSDYEVENGDGEGSDFKADVNEISDSDSEEDDALDDMPSSLKNMTKQQMNLQNYPIDSFKCLEEDCDRRLSSMNAFRSHMREKHKVKVLELTNNHLINLPNVAS